MAATTSLLPQLLLALRRFLSQIFKKGTLPSSLTRLLRHLVHLRSLFLWHRTKQHGEPSSSQKKSPARPTDQSKFQEEPKELQKELASYTIIRNGSTISLDGIAASSLYPFSNGNIRSTSRSSVRSSQNPSIRSRNASRSSRRPESFISRRSGASSAVDLGIRLQPIRPQSRHHPAPRRQWSASAPHLQTDTSERSRTPSLDIQVTSPGHISQTSLHIPPNPQPLSYAHSQHSRNSLEHINTAGTSTHYDQTTFEVPPSPSTNTHDHTRSDDNGELSSHSYIGAPIVRIPSRSIDPEKRYIRPAFPSETQRYGKRTKLLKGDTNLTFEPITLDYSKPVPPAGWIRYAHPEGARYFYNKEKKVYTDAEIYDPKILNHLEEDIEHLKAISTTFSNPFPDTGEFVINVYRGAEEIESEYYCVDHHTRLIFFLKDFHANWMDAWYEVPGVKSATQLQIELHAQYWFFIQLYPSAVDLSADMVRDLRDIVLHLIGDSMTSPYSTACFTLDNLFKILSLTGELEKNVGPTTFGSMCLLSRKMYVFTHSRFLNFHGESSARIERDFSVYDDRSLHRRTWLIKTLSFVLFSAPDVHLTTLQKMWVDGMMHKSVWEQSMKRLNDEWQEFIFFATVVLNANVAFLAIQSVDVDNHPYRSPAQISSYLSVVANIASIILGLLLMRQNRTKSRETADDVQRFLSKRNHARLGLESLAILYSLPYALLMWGMVAFLAAFAFMCFDNSNGSTRSLVGSCCCAMAILVVWCIYISWEKKEMPEVAERPLAYSDPNEPNDETDENSPKDESQEAEELCSPKLTALARFLQISTRFRPRRKSYDSGKTAVVPADDV